MTIDTSKVTEEAKPIVHKVADVYLKHTKKWFIGLVIHGSAMKGGFIKGSSDIDFQLYLRESAFVQGQLPLELCLEIQEDLAKVNPYPFRYIQCYALSPELPKNFVGLIPNSYHVISGVSPLPEATNEQLKQSAIERLDGLNPHLSYISKGLLHHGEGRLSRNVRLLCTDVWPTLYNVLTLQKGNGVEIWGLTKQQAIACLQEDSPSGISIREFYQAALAYYPEEKHVSQALRVIRTGVGFLIAAKSWWSNGFIT